MKKFILLACKVSALLVLFLATYFTYNKRQSLVAQANYQQYSFNRQQLSLQNIWSDRQFEQMIPNQKQLEFSIDINTNIIMLPEIESKASIKSSKKTQISFQSLDLELQDIRSIQKIYLINKQHNVIRIESKYFNLVYAVDEARICYERISFSGEPEVFHYDGLGNLWVFTYPKYNVVIVRIYNEGRRLLHMARHQPEERVQFVTQLTENKREGTIEVSFLTFSRNQLRQTYSIKTHQLLSQHVTKSHTFSYFKQQINQFTVLVSEKVQTLQSRNCMQELVHLLSFGYIGDKQVHEDYFYDEPLYGMAALDVQNALVLEFNKFNNKTQIISFGQVLISTKTPVFMNKHDQQKLLPFDQILNKSRSLQQVPQADFKLYGIKSKNLEIIKSKNGLYRLLPDANVHFLTFDKKMISFYPSQNLKQQEYYTVRIQNGGLALKGSQIKGIFEQVPVSNPNSIQLKNGYVKDETYHQQTTNGQQIGQSIFQAHALHKGFFVKVYKTRLDLITSLSGKSLLSHYLSTKSNYQYSTSYIENNQFWVFQHKKGASPIITKYQLFVNASAPKNLLYIKRNYEINILGRITRVQKCIDYFYYFNYITQDSQYGIARIHHALMSNRQAREDQKYAGSFQKMMVIPNIQRNQELKLTTEQQDLVKFQFNIDPEVVRNWRQLQLKLQYRILPIRVYQYRNQYYLIDNRRLMVSAFRNQILNARNGFYNQGFIISLVSTLLTVIVILLAKDRNQVHIQQQKSALLQKTNSKKQGQGQNKNSQGVAESADQKANEKIKDQGKSKKSKKSKKND